MYTEKEHLATGNWGGVGEMGTVGVAEKPRASQETQNFRSSLPRDWARPGEELVSHSDEKILPAPETKYGSPSGLFMRSYPILISGAREVAEPEVRISATRCAFIACRNVMPVLGSYIHSGQ